MKQDFSDIKDDKGFLLNLLPDELKLKHARLERLNDGTIKCEFSYITDDTLCSLAKRYDEQHQKIRIFFLLGVIGFFILFVGLLSQQILDDEDMIIHICAKLNIIIGVSLIVLAKILLIVNRKKYNNSKRKLYEYLRSKGLLLNH